MAGLLETFPWPRNDVAGPRVTLMRFVRPCILMAGRGSGPGWLKAGSWALYLGLHGVLVWEHPLGASPVHLLPAAMSLKLVPVRNLFAQ